MDGGEVEKYYRDGRIKEIAEYCESDAYRVWLRYELFRGKMTKQSYETSEAILQQFLKARNNAVPLTIKTIEYDLSVKITSGAEPARDCLSLHATLKRGGSFELPFPLSWYPALRSAPRSLCAWLFRRPWRSDAGT